MYENTAAVFLIQMIKHQKAESHNDIYYGSRHALPSLLLLSSTTMTNPMSQVFRRKWNCTGIRDYWKDVIDLVRLYGKRSYSHV